MQYGLSSQDPTGPNHFPNPNQPYYYPHPHVSPPAQFADQFASDAQVKLFTLILNAFTSTIDNNAALKNHQNWAHWHDAILQALADAGVIGHICDPPPPGVQLTKYNTPVYRPQLSAVLHLAELEAWKIWDRNNAWASSVLTACLHEDACGFLGPVINVNGSHHTAREMYESLRLGCQAAPNFTNCLHIQDEILATPIVNSDVYKFIQVWSSGLSQLPLNFPGATPCCEMFDAFAQKLVQVEQLNKSSNASRNDNNQSNRQQQPQGNRKTCRGYRGNGSVNGGVTNGGGNDPGGGETKQGNFASNLNNSATNTNTNQCTNYTVTDVPLAATTAPLGASNIITSQVYESFSALSSDLHPETSQSIDHIVKDRHFCSTYDPGGALDVTTVNAGKLSTCASGTCYFKSPIEGTDKFLVLELFDCLHAPDALVNLISTGALLEKNFCLYMTEGVVQVPSDLSPSAMATFTPRIPNGNLFHKHLLHIVLRSGTEPV
ncbi:hypothetical protein BT96DRAFT_932144 [Gymnopus androsaceus JB14]|uniref:Uncharacterized protein n=1 Tax=Gymnopus androsaceus JB14 TaxID=1447944 RepID=A0A6A4IJN9_9AGAR|nr:hypothetical protein BT96DRAFT_932144 [Gymnopus androsaceus JB14]